MRSVWCPVMSSDPSGVALFLPARSRSATPATGYRVIDQRQVDGVTHLAIPEITRVQPVATIVDRQHLGRTLGVAQCLVEIDDAVQGAAGADPLVDRDGVPLTHGGPGAGQERLVAER